LIDEREARDYRAGAKQGAGRDDGARFNVDAAALMIAHC